MAVRMTKKQAQALQTRVLQHTLDGGAVDVTPGRAKPRQIELMLQGLLFDHLRSLEGKYPRLIRVFATLNGVYIPRHLLAPIAQAGLRKGILDIIALAPRQRGLSHVCGLAIDLKAPGGRATPEQLEWRDYLRSAGWEAHIVVGAHATWQVIAEYFGIQGADYEAEELRRQESAALKLLGI